MSFFVFFLGGIVCVCVCIILTLFVLNDVLVLLVHHCAAVAALIAGKEEKRKHTLA